VRYTHADNTCQLKGFDEKPDDKSEGGTKGNAEENRASFGEVGRVIFCGMIFGHGGKRSTGLFVQKSVLHEKRLLDKRV
jgi:hypothetical protein